MESADAENKCLDMVRHKKEKQPYEMTEMVQREHTCPEGINSQKLRYPVHEEHQGDLEAKNDAPQETKAS